MHIQTPVIGIPKWKWKKEVFRYSKKHSNIHEVEIKDFCHECSRHFELLKIFDNEEDVKKSKYYIYQKETKNNDDLNIIDKIEKFRKLYLSMKIEVKFKKGVAVVTDDGCRIDGSHRLSVLNHLDYKTAPINVIVYENVFNSKKSNTIRKQVLEYRRDIYGFS